jgi:Holliday junction resolvase-like predicted endonuclease
VTEAKRVRLIAAARLYLTRRPEVPCRFDVLLVDGNPYRDLSCLLGQGEHLALIMKGGVIEHNAMGV